MKKFILLLTFVLLLNIVVLAQEEDNTVNSNNNNNNLLREYDGNPHLNTPGLSVYKPNYILPFTRSTFDDDRVFEGKLFSKTAYEVKFQLSAKQQLFCVNNLGAYIGYSQKSFWQAYYVEDSRPFRESNYNPELFLKYIFNKNFAVDFGGEHESNGGREPLSRSWNRIYIWPHFHSKYISINFKLWYRIPEKDKENPGDTEGDENPDIHEYYGYSELGINLNLFKCQISTLSRYNFKTKKGGFQADLSIPTFYTSAFIQFQYWGGYGESLIDYNIFQHKVGVGLMLSR